MSARDRALKDLLESKDWDEIIHSHSKSSIYSALDEYFRTAKKEYAESCSKREKIKNDISELDKKKQRSKTELEDLDNITQEKAIEANHLREEVDKLEHMKKEKQAKLQEIGDKIDELNSKGITLKLLTHIAEIDSKSSDELLTRVKASEDYEGLVNKLKLAGTRLRDTNNSIKEAELYLEELEENIRSEKNKLQKLQSENLAYSEAVNLIIDALKIYPSDIIIGIIKSLRRCEIIGQPTTSVKRLIKIVEQAGENLNLDQAIIAKTKELETINNEVTRVRGILKTLEKSALEPIRKVQNEAVKRIDSTAEAALGNMEAVSNQSLSRIKSVEKSAITNIQRTYSDGKGKLKQVTESHTNALNNLFWNTYASIKLLNQEMEKFGKLKEEAGKLETQLNTAALLTGILNNPNEIQKLDPRLVAIIADRLDLYVSMKHPDHKTMAPKELSSKDWGISSMYQANLSSVSKWLSTELWKLGGGN